MSLQFWRPLNGAEMSQKLIFRILLNRQFFSNHRLVPVAVVCRSFEPTEKQAELQVVCFTKHVIIQTINVQNGFTEGPKILIQV